MPKGQYTRPIRAAIIPIGPSIAYVPLTRGMHALIDKDDAEWVQQWNWHSTWDGTSSIWYARRGTPRSGPRKESNTGTVTMHAALLGAANKFTADHIVCGNGLDNRRCNLRLATSDQQRYNKRVRADSLTGLRGVRKNGTRWSARVGINGKRLCLGTFETAQQAHAAYVAKAKELHGEFFNAG